MKTIYFFLSAFLVGCFQDFDNPIDPLENGVPSAPVLRDLSVVEGKTTVNLLIDYDYDHADGILVFRRDDGINFLIVDTLKKDVDRYTDSVGLNWDSDYVYRLASFNKNGLSKYSKEVNASIGSEPELEVGDTTRPVLFVDEGSYRWNTDSSALIVRDSTHLQLQISGTITDDAGIDSMAVNGVPISIDPVSSEWNYSQEITEYRFKIVIFAQDKSDQKNSVEDTLQILFDYKNTMPDSIQISVDGSDILLQWSSSDAPDFKEYVIRVADGTVPTTTGQIVGSTTATNYRYTPTNSLGSHTSFTLSLVDSLDNEVHTYAMLGSGLMDSRDAQYYKTTTIGTQTWMAENLNYDILDGEGSWCYGESKDTCDLFGRLYLERTISGVDSVEYRMGNPTKGICPLGWHLPSDEAWDILKNYVAQDLYSGVPDSVPYALYSSSASGWFAKKGSDIYDFNLLPGGYKVEQFSPAGFSQAGNEAWFWMQETNYSFSSPKNLLRTYPYDGGFYWDYDYRETSNAYMAYSLRCLKD